MEIIEYIVVSFLSIVVLFVITKFMGYRQVSQLSMYDYINGITIGSIAAELVMTKEDLFQPLVAMVVYAIVIIGLSKLTSKSLKFRKLIDGHAVILYENDQIYYQELIKAKIDLDEFLMQCRIAGYFNLSQLQTIVLESNGSFSFFPKEKYRLAAVNDLNIKINKVELPTLLIKEGKIYQENLKKINRDNKWLFNQLNINNTELKDIVLMYAENDHLTIYKNNESKKDFDLK